MVSLLELCLLRLLHKKNCDRTLEFPVRAFSELSQADYLTIDDIIELTDLDHQTIEPIVKKLVRQKIVRNKNGKFHINKNIHSINRLLEETAWTRL